MGDAIETSQRMLPRLAKRHRKAFAYQLRMLRERERWTQAELGKRCGLQASAIAHFEAGRRAPSFENLVRLTYVLGGTVDRLMGFGWDTKEG